MGHKVHPNGFRLGVSRTWNAKWYSDKEYTDLLREDIAIRTLVQKRLANASVSLVEIERGRGADGETGDGRLLMSTWTLCLRENSSNAPRNISMLCENKRSPSSVVRRQSRFMRPAGSTWIAITSGKSKGGSRSSVTTVPNPADVKRAS